MRNKNIVFEAKRYWSSVATPAPAVGLPDVSPFGNNGTFNGSVAWLQLPSGRWVCNHYGAAAGDYISITDASSIRDVPIFTWIAWIYPIGWGFFVLGAIIDKGARTLYLDGTNAWLEFFQSFAGNQGNWNTPAASLALNRWFQVAVTYDSTNVANNPLLYINGVSQVVTESEAPAGVIDSDLGLPLKIGNSFFNRTFLGYILPVLFARHIYTPAQIRDDFEEKRHWVGI